MNKIFRNSLINVLQVVIVTPVFFLLIPYTISKIGYDGYGLYALVGVMASYQVFVEMGFTNTLVRFVAQSVASNRPEMVSEYLSTTITFFLVITVIFYLLIHLFSFGIVEYILRIRDNTTLVVQLVRIAALSALVNVVSGLFKSLIDGVQRMDVSNLIVTLQVLLSAAGTVVVLEAGLGIRGLFLNGLVFSVASLIANIVASGKMVQYKLRLGFSRQRFREMFSYSVNLQLSSLLFFWIEPVNKILITYMLPISYVGFYDIAIKISGRITTLVRSGLSSIFPAAAEKHEQTGNEGIDALRVKSLRYIFPLVTALYTIGMVITPSFVILWLGKDLEITILAIMIMLVGSYFSVLATPAYILLMGAGFSRDTLRVQIQASLTNVAAIALFASLFGFYGFCAGYACAMIYGFFATHRIYRQRFGREIKVYQAFKHRSLWISCLLILLLFVAYSAVFKTSNWVSLIVVVILLSITTFVSFWKFRIFTIDDYHLLFGRQRRSG